MSVSGAGRQAAGIPVSGGVVSAIGAVAQQAQRANRIPVAAPIKAMPGMYALQADAASIAPGDSTDLTFSGDEAAAHGILRSGATDTFYLPSTGCNLAAVSVSSTDHDSGLVTFTIDGGLAIQHAFSPGPDLGATQYWLIGSRGAAVTATIEAMAGGTSTYTGGVFLQPLGTDAIK